LRQYIVELLGRLQTDEPALARRVREVVGRARARIVLDDEAVEVAWGSGGLTVEPVEDGEDGDLARAGIDGVGATDRATTLELLAGRLEVHEAVLAGRLRVRGSVGDVARMVHAIELLLDASARVPALQDLARDYREDPCREPPPGPRPPRSAPPIAWFPRVLSDGEARLLDELGLLPTSEG
jgi:hypothetical protein